MSRSAWAQSQPKLRGVFNCTQTRHRCTSTHLLSLSSDLSDSCDHSPNAFAYAQGAPENRVAFDTFSLVLSFSLFLSLSLCLSLSLSSLCSLSVTLFLPLNVTLSLALLSNYMTSLCHSAHLSTTLVTVPPTLSRKLKLCYNTCFYLTFVSPSSSLSPVALVIVLSLPAIANTSLLCVSIGVGTCPLSVPVSLGMLSGSDLTVRFDGRHAVSLHRPAWTALTCSSYPAAWVADSQSRGSPKSRVRHGDRGGSGLVVVGHVDVMVVTMVTCADGHADWSWRCFCCWRASLTHGSPLRGWLDVTGDGLEALVHRGPLHVCAPTACRTSGPEHVRRERSQRTHQVARRLVPSSRLVTFVLSLSLSSLLYPSLFPSGQDLRFKARARDAQGQPRLCYGLSSDQL